MIQTQSWGSLQTRMQEHGDHENANKLAELTDKLQAGKAAIALSGHFSAGKSSLINLLCGRKLLPTGPIPTSANLVVIEHGPEEVTVYTGENVNGESQAIRAPIDELEAYCKNGEQYRRIDIRYPSERLADKLLLMDTPGVDSTDDAHMLATESSLHLADAVLYVTDYNHVLSELNLSFTKRLKDWGKPLYIIVNQVDKHQDSELSYEQYKSNVIESFRSWGVEPEGFLFVSVKSPHHPSSEWNKLIWVIEQLKARASDLLAYSTARSAAVILQEHAAFVYPDQDMDSDQQAVWEKSEQQLKLVQQEIDALMQRPEQIASQFRHDLNKLADNAPIMPASLRELADHYLQSRKPGFKMGFLFTEGKTKAEIAERLSAFYTPLRDGIEKHLVWHANQLIRQVAEDYGESDRSIPAIESALAPNWLVEEVKESAAITGEYTMTYCRQLAERIKHDCKRRALDVVSDMLNHTQKAVMKRAEPLLAKREELLASVEEGRAWAQRSARKEAYVRELNDLLRRELASAAVNWPDPNEAPLEEFATAQVLSDDTDQSIRAEPAESGDVSLDRRAPIGAMGINSADASATVVAESDFHYRDIMLTAADSLTQIAEELDALRSFEQLRMSLLGRADKLRNNRFTAALFGAFSAGKSSFANALIGQAVLPVSPNPTTAAINSILPPTELNQHQTALIHMKSHDALLSDIRYSMSMLGLHGDSVTGLEQAAELMKQLHAAQVPAKGKPHLSFIHAALSGYADVRERLGTVWTADFETYKSFVAEEHRSCFVDSIDLHYHTTFGDQGVVFVDTPGADSIHARHTGVTFNYIKNADAIVFVTYYNHAFSQADKQFLMQLGRVKDSFDLDKMFFIVNAADLAASEEELDEVLTYVEGQLLAHGIRNPRLFAMSSRLALEAKQHTDSQAIGESGIAAFEQAFSQFARDELASTMMRSARLEAEAALKRLQQALEAQQQGEAARAEKAAQLRGNLSALSLELKRRAQELSVASVGHELDELLHHVKQRYTYRFGDLYNDAFHPSSLREDGRDMAMALQSAWQQLLQSSAIDLSQELLATTLRMEHYIRQRTARWQELAVALVDEQMPECTDIQWKDYIFDMPAIDETLGELSTDERVIRRSFKSARAFFEGGGKQALRQLLETDVTAAVSDYIARHAEHLSELYERMMRDAILAAFHQLIEQLEQYVEQVYQHKEESWSEPELQLKIVRIHAHIQRFARE